MKVKASTMSDEEKAKARAREFYKKLETKEAAKRQSHHDSPAYNPPLHKEVKSPCKSTTASYKKTTPSKTNNTANADAERRARQYFDKLQAKKDQTPPPKTNVSWSSTTYESGGTGTSWFASKKSIDPTAPTPDVARTKSSRFVDILCNDMYKLEQMEANEMGQERSTNGWFSTGQGTKSSQSNVHSYSTKDNFFGIPKTHIMNHDTPFSTPPMAESPRQHFHPEVATKISSQQPSGRTNLSTDNRRGDPTSENAWLGRVFTTLDVITFIVLYLLEMNFHILSSIGIILIRCLMQLSWKMVVNAYEQGSDMINIVTTLIACIGCCILVRYLILPSAFLLRSFRTSRTTHTDQMHSDVVVILHMVYNELMNNEDVNVPLRSLQDMIFARLFMDEAMGSSTNRHSTKDRKYWTNIIWPRVIEQLLFRNPYVVIERNKKETYVRWKPSADFVSNDGSGDSNDSGAMFKKRKAA